MISIVESAETFLSDEMQNFIANERKKTQKKWVFDILEGKREVKSVLYWDPDGRFLIVPSTPYNEKNLKGYMVIFKDNSLRCMRDLRGKHINLLVDACEAAYRVIPPSFTHASIHYHPSVYQLHIHFRQPCDINLNDSRVFTLFLILVCLVINPNFFVETSLVFTTHNETELVRLLRRQSQIINKRTFTSCVKPVLRINVHPHVNPATYPN